MSTLRHWLHVLVVFLIVVVAGLILLPLVRSSPETLHSFVVTLHEWQRHGLIFTLCVVLTFLLFNLLSPRLSHLRHLLSHPPTWVAVLLAISVIGWIDVKTGLAPKGYRATPDDWWSYGLGSFVAVLLYRFLSIHLKEIDSSPRTKAPLALQDVSHANWKDIESWLVSDAPADCDFLGSHAVAERLSRLLVEGCRSIGLIGPFGAGKTSIVNWVVQNLKDRKDSVPRLLISKHSCWGFENSASSIHEMLADSIKTVEREIDTFHVKSLPDSYRETFAAGGEWFESISNAIVRKSNPSDEFQALSDLLGDMNARLVFIVEDLDRNNSRSFDVQEVVAFLEQLKSYSNLSFILTGGLTSSRTIDFAKLCDHIEYLNTIEASHVSAFVDRVYSRCTNNEVFPHEIIGNQTQSHEWSLFGGVMMRDYEELSLTQAVAFLLNTPRSLRHALGRTWSSWKTLNGEIDLNHLLAINVLRFGAPEAFQFVMRRWDRLRYPPNQNSSFGQARLDAIRQAIQEDWRECVETVDWSPSAALVVMTFLFPSSEAWLTEEDANSQGEAAQGVQHSRYWRRAVNESIDPGEVRDQEVIRDLRKWTDSQREDAQMIARLCSSKAYSDLWEHLASNTLAGNDDKILLVCQQVIRQILREHGAIASDDSQGFAATWRFANRRVSHRPENRGWLEAMISIAASASLEMVNSLWHNYGPPGGYSILRRDDGEEVKRHVLETLRGKFADPDLFERVLSTRHPWSLHHLVFDPDEEGTLGIGEIADWLWLGQVILRSLQRGNVSVAVLAAHLMAAADPGPHRERWRANPDALFAFFPTDASEAASLLIGLAQQVNVPELQKAVKEIGESASVASQERGSAE